MSFPATMRNQDTEQQRKSLQQQCLGREIQPYGVDAYNYPENITLETSFWRLRIKGTRACAQPHSDCGGGARTLQRTAN